MISYYFKQIKFNVPICTMQAYNLEEEIYQESLKRIEAFQVKSITRLTTFKTLFDYRL